MHILNGKKGRKQQLQSTQVYCRLSSSCIMHIHICKQDLVGTQRNQRLLTIHIKKPKAMKKPFIYRTYTLYVQSMMLLLSVSFCSCTLFRNYLNLRFECGQFMLSLQIYFAKCEPFFKISTTAYRNLWATYYIFIKLPCYTMSRSFLHLH